MSKTISGKDVVRAWKDADYCESLSAEERAALPNHPAGLVDLSDAELESVRGAGLNLTANCIPGTATGAFECDLTIVRLSNLNNPCQYTFAAPIPENGCQFSVNNWTCRDLPKL
jgi:mersacidin/lichenicidin family type 2 lantibiotic